MPAEQLSRSSDDQAREQTKKQRERTLRDASLLQEGAEYVVDIGGDLRLEVTPKQLIEIHGEMVDDFQRRVGKVIEQELDEKPIEDIIASHPELAAHVEAIPLGKDGEPISLIRMRGVSAFAMPVWAKSKMRHGTQGRVFLQVPDVRLPEGIPHIAEFRSVCACCPVETRGLQSPYQTNMPKWQDATDRMHERAMEDWRATNEGQLDTKWHEQQKQAYRDAMQRACTENGIRFLAMRHGANRWDERYGALEGVEMLEITDLEDVREKIRTLRIGAGLPEKALGFRIED